jgi:hypothetical protein
VTERYGQIVHKRVTVWGVLLNSGRVFPHSSKDQAISHIVRGADEYGLTVEGNLVCCEVKSETSQWWHPE